AEETEAKLATTTLDAFCAGSSRSVTSVMTPSVPSLPTKSLVRLSPATSLRRGPPSRTAVPSASATVMPSTWPVVTPYFTQHRPPALVAILPLMLQISYDDGSGGYQS